MRRKDGDLLPLEVSILESARELQNAGNGEFHGFAIAKTIREREQARALTAHGTLYKALARMENRGLLESRWEDAVVAAGENRPRRRLYRITGRGEQALASVVDGVRQRPPRLEEGLAPS